MDGTSQRIRSPRWAIAAVIAFLFSVTIAVWGLLGDLSEPGGYHQIVPIKFPAALERAFVILSIPAALTSLILLIVAFRSRGLDRRWVAVVATLAIAALAIGFGARVLAAETDGANIGGGILIVLGGPLLLVLLGGAALISRQIRRSS